MYNNALPIGIVLIGLAVPLVVLAILVVKSSHVWQRHLAGRPWWVKAAAVGCLGVAVLWGGGKGPVVIIPQALVEILTVRPDGVLGDLSGRVVPGVQAQAVADYIEASAGLVDAADGVIEQARLDCIALTNQLLTADYQIGYLSLDLPRGTTTQTNHNIMVTFQRVEQSAETLDALVWFSEMPSTNVNVYAEYSIRDGVWSTLSPVTNYWPATEIVDGVECVRYRYAIPSAINGTPLKPNYEVSFRRLSAGPVSQRP